MAVVVVVEVLSVVEEASLVVEDSVVSSLRLSRRARGEVSGSRGESGSSEAPSAAVRRLAARVGASELSAVVVVSVASAAPLFRSLFLRSALLAASLSSSSSALALAS